jgi:plastocyanin
MRQFRMCGLLLVGLVVTMLPSKSNATIHHISIVDNDFTPLNTIVTQGDTVRWTYNGSILHTTTSDPSSPVSWNSGNMTIPGSTFQIVITLADPTGNYPYRCTPHALIGMRDTLRVVAPAMDTDGDGILDQNDNCPTVQNPLQEDLDADGAGDVCDNCPAIPNPLQEDVDADGRGNVCDNCPNIANPGQEDTDLDGIGDACEVVSCCVKEGDCNHNNTVNVVDLTFLVARLFQGGPPPPCAQEADVNDSGSVNVVDLTTIVAFLFSGGSVGVCP